MSTSKYNLKKSIVYDLQELVSQNNQMTGNPFLVIKVDFEEQESREMGMTLFISEGDKLRKRIYPTGATYVKSANASDRTGNFIRNLMKYFDVENNRGGWE